MTQLAPNAPEFETDDDPRARYRILRFAFALGAVALGIQSAEIALHLFVTFTGDAHIEKLLGLPGWRYWIGPPITFGAALSAYLTIGRFPDDSWNRRAILLSAMNTFDIGLWVADHAQELNLLNPLVLWVKHPLIREGVYVLQWFELGLFMSLASDLIRHLGRDSAIDLQRTGRATALFGLITWLVGYGMAYAGATGMVRANRRFFRQYHMLKLLSSLLLAMTAFQATVLCLVASRDCARLLANLRRGEHDPEYRESFGDEPRKKSAIPGHERARAGRVSSARR
jgi:hypothetical protein